MVTNPEVESKSEPEIAVDGLDGARQLDLDPAHLEEFFVELEKVIKENVIPPGMWARGFVDKIGIDTAKMIVDNVPVDSVIDLARQNESSVIVTRDGQQFVRKVWSEVASM